MKNTNYIKIGDRYYFHPGYYIDELMSIQHYSLSTFANKTGISEEDLRLLIKGRKDLTPHIAKQLSDALGTSMRYWLNLQVRYDKGVNGYE